MTTLSSGEEGSYTFASELSSSGHVVSVYLNPEYTESGNIVGGFKLVNLHTGETILTTIPDVVGVFHLQP